MPEKPAKAPHDIERQTFQDYLATVDRDTDKLQELVNELYSAHPENPHMLYLAATHLTSMTYLDRRNEKFKPQLPAAEDAQKAFESYTKLISLSVDERNSPLYEKKRRIRKQLTGTREELSFHAILSYARACGADFWALPSPAELDFGGAQAASDIQVFFSDPAQESREIQITSDIKGKAKKGRSYLPHIAVLNLETALNDPMQAAKLRGLLRDIGNRDPDRTTNLPPREHEMLLDGATAILQKANELINTPPRNEPAPSDIAETPEAEVLVSAG